jgi:hypothetical protein
MEVTPIVVEVKVIAKTTLRSAFMVLVSAITAASLVSLQPSREDGISRIVGLGIDVAPDLLLGCRTTSGE